MARIGIEEEFVLLDDRTLVPLGMGPGARERITGRNAGGEVVPEYLTCQFECVTEPLSTLAEADADLRRLRGLLAAYAAQHGGVAASTGTPFISPGGLAVSPSGHYHEVSDQLAEITREHLVNGLHVHVESGDDEERVRTLNRLRGWLPLLLALTGNAPFAHGVASGFQSWRSILIRRLPSSWCPPQFHDYDDYRTRTERLVDLRAIPEAASLAWAVRLSERFPTVELRVFDAQLTPAESLFAVSLARAIALGGDAAVAPAAELDGIDASLWMAARDGTNARVIDPMTGEVDGVWLIAARLLDAIGPVLRELGEEDFVRDRLDAIRADGTGAQRQQLAWDRDGVAGLRDLYRSSTESP
ncbi:YbdK family carboxylate-amine ligase [Microbacterium sp. KUDC0406]|uniref:carboxylate-amine ligase n=1 Tax=Microbacterium sp. KUDC0406 TaxID=2909588 RepID=UPI001F37B873|nr:YbdK family carboxylate-amine ligase [Microbacterium sp. KUDC0406]UJP10179.1 YbdK family carboxylate-amine ligase [Microbacterium sp. KUDC0406]